MFPADRIHTPPPRRFEGRRLWARDAAFVCFLAALAVLSTAVTWAQDSLPPALNSAGIVGSTLTLTYDKALDETSVPVPGSFEVTVTRSNRVVTAVAVGGRDVTLTLETPVQAGQSVQVSYHPACDVSGAGFGRGCGGGVQHPRQRTPRRLKCRSWWGRR